ncbi:transcription factor sfp1 [Acrodontium crateriforme]|uniref:Transcription factor sfp1 n=1 Tax=Acrodontium crateriforme TaxID=150365 RepID=A0AAQ3MCA9_9PEZI|nr:transcription factor sfp1 [Acrodontium crateriforme]
MAGPASPIDIGPSSRQGSGSPRSQQSTLTSQLQNTQNTPNPRIDVKTEHPTTSEPSAMNAPPPRPRQESIAMLGSTPYGARSIPVKDGMRRESNALSGSLMGGMSWGGISMGSFIRDDILMAGTSPYQFQSPSFHSSSYLPKMEANYMKDYVCCDIHLDSMHELLQHYEEAHAAQPTQTMGRTPKDQQFPSTRAANATSTAQNVQQQAQFQQPNNLPRQTQNPPLPNLQANASPLFSGQSQDHMGAFDNLDDMDMDEGTPGPQMPPPQGSQFQPQPQFGRQQPRGPAVNVNLANAFQGQGMQTPTTPRASQGGMGLPNNPTVSSVNTPTLGTQMSLQTATPESSMPGTPAEPSEIDYSQLGNMDYSQLMQGNFDFNSLNLNGNMIGSSGTIDDPAKRLLSKPGQGNKGFPNPALANNSELAKRIRENQLLNGLAGVGGFVGEEIKPFKCPVIGCEKAYKNQNGLKYHKQHGHQNQQLKENPDGTFSIVDPATSIPYPGTVGMEKEKPYRCEVCGKRYKNLNGLKYHRQHSPPCNPELKQNGGAIPAMVNNNIQGMSVNVAGAGLMGINEGMGAY